MKILLKIDANVCDPDGDEDELDQLVDEFETISEHPAGRDLMFWPEPGADDSNEGIVAEVERWRLENGLPI